MRGAVVALLSLIVSVSEVRAEDLQSMQASYDGFAAAFNSGDSARLSQLYAVDAIIMPPNAKTIKGKDNIQQYYRTALGSVADSKFTTTDSKSLGDNQVLEIGTFTSKTRGAHPRLIAGKFAIVWQKADSDWKVILDIWNLNA